MLCPSYQVPAAFENGSFQTLGMAQAVEPFAVAGVPIILKSKCRIGGQRQCNTGYNAMAVSLYVLADGITALPALWETSTKT